MHQFESADAGEMAAFGHLDSRLLAILPVCFPCLVRKVTVGVFRILWHLGGWQISRAVGWILQCNSTESNICRFEGLFDKQAKYRLLICSSLLRWFIVYQWIEKEWISSRQTVGLSESCHVKEISDILYLHAQPAKQARHCLLLAQGVTSGYAGKCFPCPYF